MMSNIERNKPRRPLVLRRGSAAYPGRGKRIHGIVFDHPSMPKIMTVSSVSKPANPDQNTSVSRQHRHRETCVIPKSPPALIRSPSGLTSVTSSGGRANESNFHFPLANNPANSPHRTSTYQLGYPPNYQTRPGNPPCYIQPACRASVSSEMPVMELYHSSAQQQVSKIRYPVSTTAQRSMRQYQQNTDPIHRKRMLQYDKQQMMRPGEKATLTIHHAASHGPSHMQYSLSNQAQNSSQCLSRPGSTRFQLAQHLNTRRNSTGCIPGRLESSVSEYSKNNLEQAYVGATCSLKEFSRQFHRSTWPSSGDDCPEGAKYQSTDGSRVETPGSRAAPPLSCRSDGTCQASCAVSRVTTCNRTSETWAPQSTRENLTCELVSLASSRNRENVAAYQTYGTESVTSCRRSLSVDSHVSTRHTNDRLKHIDTQLWTTKTSVHLSKPKIKKTSTVVVISDSEDEGETNACLRSSPSKDWDGNAFEVFATEQDGKYTRKENVPISNVEKNSGKIENVLYVRRLSSQNERTKTLKRETAEPIDLTSCDVDETRDNHVEDPKTRYRSVLMEQEGHGQSYEKKSVVLSEEVFYERGNNGVKENRIDDSQEKLSPTALEYKLSCGTKVNHENHEFDIHGRGNVNEASDSKRHLIDENGNISFWSQERNMKLEASLDKVCKNGDNGISEKTAMKCKGSEESSRLEYSGLKSDRKSGCVQAEKKESVEAVEKSCLVPSRNGALSPTFELGFLTCQLSKLTDNDTKSKINNSECVKDFCRNESNAFDSKVHKVLDEKYACKAEQNAATVLHDVKKKKSEYELREGSHFWNQAVSSDDKPLGIMEKASGVKLSKKPTGIVVGVKQERCTRDPLRKCTADSSDFTKPCGRTAIRDGDGFLDCKKTGCEIKKSVGVLQFNVIEKEPGVEWRNEDEFTKYTEGSRVKGITSQQWEAYSVKLETEAKRKQCSLDEAHKPYKLRNQEPETKNLHEAKIAEQNVPQKVDQKHCSEVASKTDRMNSAAGKIADSINALQESNSAKKALFKVGRIDQLNAPELSNIKGLVQKQIEVIMSCERTNKQKRPVSFLEDIESQCAVTVNTKHCVEVEPKRRKISDGESDNEHSMKQGKLDNAPNSTADTSSETKEQFSEEKSVIPSLKHVRTTSHSTVTLPGDKKNTANESKPNELATLNQICHPTDEQVNCERKEVLTANEWKEILIGRIEQVRESIEMEQTPWKTKNKKKVLEKLEQQLKWWDGPGTDEAAFISRKLQFFQTMRNQYELMKKIGTQRSSLKKAVKTPDNDENTTDDGPVKKVLKVVNDVQEKKKTKPVRRKVNSSLSGNKRGRPSLKKLLRAAS